MTGIFGYLSKNINKKTIQKVIHIIQCSEYNINKRIIDDSYILGELDIKSVKTKKQITHKKGDRISVITCGEVYNDDIENLDESILKLYKEGRLDKLKNFNGSFAAAIYDQVEGKLTLINDRYGLIKLFYYQDSDNFWFAPKIKPLIKLGAEKSLRKDAIVDFFLFGYLLGDKTFFENIHQLPPASVLEISKNDTNLIKYWDYEYDEGYDTKSNEELIEELGALWQKAVERRIKKDEKIIIPLSGGLDSRAILAAALKCTLKDKIITFTFGEPGSFDFEIGKLVAKKAGVRNIQTGVEKENFEEQYNISMNDIEGMIDATPYFIIKDYKKMIELGDKIYTGYMGETIMGSHISSKMLNKKLKSEQDYIDSKSIIFEEHLLNDLEDIKKLFNPFYINIENIEYSLERTLEELKRISNEDMVTCCSIWDYKHRQNKYTMFAVFKYGEFFKYSTPFLDNELIDFMLKIPPELRFNENLYIQMLLKKYPELFKLPTKTNLGLKLDAGRVSLLLRRAVLSLKIKANKISNMLIRRNIFLDKMKNYINYDELLRRNKEYREYIRSVVDKIKEREYFNKDYIEEIWRLQIRGKKNYAMLFGLLVTFELFLERFVDKKNIKNEN
jgi:asparagine synthase (glutamine-hydrolysing)